MTRFKLTSLIVRILPIILLSNASVLPHLIDESSEDAFNCDFNVNTKSVRLFCEKNGKNQTNSCHSSIMTKETWQKVETLSIDGCKILTMFDLITSFENLHELSITYSDLDQTINLPLQSLPQIQRLNLSHNNFSAIPEAYFENIPKLLDADLSFNEIETVDLLAFSGASSLKTINLSHNNIKNLKSGTFVFTPNLEKLKLIGNKQMVKFYSWTFPPGKNVMLKWNDNGLNVGNVDEGNAEEIDERNKSEMKHKTLICHKNEPNIFFSSISVHVSEAVFPDFKCVSLRESRTLDVTEESRTLNIAQNTQLNINSRTLFNTPLLNLNEYPKKETLNVTDKRIDETHNISPRLLGEATKCNDEDEPEIFGLTSDAFETVCIIVISIAIALLMIFVALIIREHLIIKRCRVSSMKASCRPGNIVRIKAIENDYVFRNI